MSQIEPDRGQIVPSVESDETAILAHNAYLTAVSARARADEAYSYAQSVSTNASNALTSATTANSLANAAQDTANQAISSQVSITGGTLTGPLFLPPSNPTGATEAAHKAYVDYAVGAGSTDIFNSLQASKANKTYVDDQDAALQTQITTGSNQITDLYTKIMPPGGIIMWSGSIATIPTGWRLCDGTNGTPDLRNKFILGAGPSSPAPAPNTSGGVATATTSQDGIHTHTGTISTAGTHNHGITVNGTAISIEQMPSHAHQFGYGKSGVVTDNGGGDRVNGIGTTGNIPVVVTSVGGNQPHSHTASSANSGAHTHTATIDNSVAHSHTVPIIPPYYALCFIMKA